MRSQVLVVRALETEQQDQSAEREQARRWPRAWATRPQRTKIGPGISQGYTD